MPIPLVVQTSLPWPKLSAGAELYCFSIGPHQEILCLSAFSKPFSAEKHYVVHWFEWGNWQQLALAPTEQNFNYLQPLPDQQWLLVGAWQRSHRLNACVYTPEGQLHHAFAVDEAVNDVQASAQGLIWTSYFDQNFAAGVLNAWDRQGEVYFEGFSTFGCGDSYAMNVVANDEVWCLRYPGVALMRVKGLRTQIIWESGPVKGAHAFAIWKDRAVMVGEYGLSEQIVRVDLNTFSIEPLQLLDETGEPLHNWECRGRGPCLYFFTDDRIHCLDLRKV
ncbi:MAG: hypothetical protein IV090_01170 [Candidatus Sericytochromatia bacterium]|nr:hypothetical protein [Candidatus Sericytochromatia bacterium]